MTKIPLKDLTPPATVELYAPRQQVYTRAFTGVFRDIRRVTGALLFVLFFGTAWLEWDGHQAVWWNLPARQFFIFGSTFWPQDFFLLSGILILCAFGLFFITVYAGRVWCGYACPQSVWTWLFMWCEKVTEGDRQQRIRLDAAPTSVGKVVRKSAKHSLWLGIGLATGLTFVGYFSPIRDLTAALLSGQANGWSYVWVGFFTLATYLNAGWLREQVCIHMCPYSRFQGAMFDSDTLIVSYNPARGEPRGTRRKDADPGTQGLGDCIDCTMCVQVCPTGIDIREGLQIECIGCAACIDACDSVMGKMNYPKGLISYTTERALAGHKPRTLRPRLLAYGLVLTLMLGALATAFVTRPLLALDVSKDRMLYRENAEGRIENVYSLNIMNKAQRAYVLVIDAQGDADLQLDAPAHIRLAAGERLSVPVRLSMAPEAVQVASQVVTFSLRAAHGSNTEVATRSRFNGPVAH